MAMIFGDPVDEAAVAQLENCMRDERVLEGALMADHHLGYSMPIGGVLRYQDAISPSGVGFDIACGNKAVRTSMRVEELLPKLPQVMAQIRREVAFGIGRTAAVATDHPLFDYDTWEHLGATGKKGGEKELKRKARAQLGTVGSGNHYVDLLVDDLDRIWVAVHFGSRGFGHTVASGFLAIAQGKNFDDRVGESETPAVLDTDTDAGRLYIEAMRLAGEYAYAGRDIVVGQVLGILGNPEVTMKVHNHHNFAWEGADGSWIVRKGATPLDRREAAFIGGSMGTVSMIVRGKDEPGWTLSAVPPTWDIGAIGSAPHGAGRVMSRTKAAGRWKKVPEVRKRPDGSEYTFKRRVRDGEGLIDWPAVQGELSRRGIVVLGSGADEAPGVYKDIEQVIALHPNIEVMERLQPLGVVMAGDDVNDPYQD